MAVDSDARLEFSGSEALVLFELLARWEAEITHWDAEQGSMATCIMRRDVDGTELASVPFIEHRAEQRVLWKIVCMLERQLVAPFRPDYAELVDAAREAVRDGL